MDPFLAMSGLPQQCCWRTSTVAELWALCLLVEVMERKAFPISADQSVLRGARVPLRYGDLALDPVQAHFLEFVPDCGALARA